LLFQRYTPPIPEKRRVMRDIPERGRIARADLTTDSFSERQSVGENFVRDMAGCTTDGPICAESLVVEKTFAEFL
jgi:hypothetical protein